MSWVMESTMSAFPTIPTPRKCPLPYATTYASRCRNIHNNVPVLMHTGPASGNPHLDVLNTIHSDMKWPNATTYAHIAN